MSTPYWIVMPYLGCWEMTQQAITDCLAQTGLPTPPQILAIDTGSTLAVRAEMEAWMEREPRLHGWFHRPGLPSLSATWNLGLRFVWEQGGGCALVVNNDVRLHRATYSALWEVQQGTEALFVSAVGRREADMDWEKYFASMVQVLGAPGGGPDFSCFLLTEDGHTRYPFDEGFRPAYCVTPDTPVLTKDLRWITIGDVHAGDEIIGVDEHEQSRTKGEYRRRCYRVAKVTEVRRRLAPCLKLWLADGRTVTCSTDHKWLTKYPKGSAEYRWRAASELSIGYRIATPLDVWPAPSTYEDGWLAGIADGEGTLRAKVNNRCEVNIAQKEGMILDEIKRMLESVKIPFTWRIRPENNVGTVEIGVRRHVLRFLGQFRPKRLLDKMRWEDLSLFSRSVEMGIPITGIQPVGEQEVVTIETSTHTYLANGMVAHNCEDNDAHRRYLLNGDGERIFSVNLPYLHYGSATVNADPSQRQRWAERLKQSRAYYTQKWGGDVNHERYTIPFEAQSDQDGVTNPELQARILHAPTT